MYIYILLIILSLSFLIFNKKITNSKKKRHIIFFFTIITIISSIRSLSVGVDTIQYYYSFKYISNHTWSNILLLRYEYGFLCLCKLLSLLTNNPQILIVASSFIIFPSIGYFIYKYSKNIYLSIFFYITLNIYFSHLNIMRQAIAISFLIISIKSLLDDKKISFIFWVIISSLFHFSSIFFILLLPLMSIKYNKRTYFYISIISIILCVFCIPILNFLSPFLGKYVSYLTSKQFGTSNYFAGILKFLLYFLIYTFCHFIYCSRKFESENDRLYKLLLIMCSIVVIFQSMSIKLIIISRLVPCYLIAVIILLPNSVCSVQSGKKRALTYIAAIIISISYFLIIATFRPEWTGAVPYLPYWSERIIDWSGYLG